MNSSGVCGGKVLGGSVVRTQVESFNCRGAVHWDAGLRGKNASFILTLGTDSKAKSASTIKLSATKRV